MTASEIAFIQNRHNVLERESVPVLEMNASAELACTGTRHERSP